MTKHGNPDLRKHRLLAVRQNPKIITQKRNAAKENAQNDGHNCQRIGSIPALRLFKVRYGIADGFNARQEDEPAEKAFKNKIIVMPGTA